MTASYSSRPRRSQRFGAERLRVDQLDVVRDRRLGEVAQVARHEVSRLRADGCCEDVSILEIVGHLADKRLPRARVQSGSRERYVHEPDSPLDRDCYIARIESASLDEQPGAIAEHLDLNRLLPDRPV
jgi:hypothetical protein